MRIVASVHKNEIVSPLMAVASWAFEAPHFKLHWIGDFSVPKSRKSGWVNPTTGEYLRGAARALEDGHFGLVTAGGNSVKFLQVTDKWWNVEFDTSRHALLDAGNGVGQVFESLGGLKWAQNLENGPEVSWASTSTSPWWVAGVEAYDRRFYSDDYGTRCEAIADLMVADLAKEEILPLLHWGLLRGPEEAIEALEVAGQRELALSPTLMAEAQENYKDGPNPIDEEVDEYFDRMR